MNPKIIQEIGELYDLDPGHYERLAAEWERYFPGDEELALRWIKLCYKPEIVKILLDKGWSYKGVKNYRTWHNGKHMTLVALLMSRIIQPNDVPRMADVSERGDPSRDRNARRRQRKKGIDERD
jgi:hypothetical protein